MNLEQIITDQMKAAMKSGDKLRLETVRSVRAAILEFNTSGVGRTMNDDDEVKLLQKLAKKRKDAMDIFRANGRDEAADKEQAELAILEEFLPTMLDEKDVQEVVKRVISESGATSQKDFGKVIGAAMKELRGKADGTLVQAVVKSMLSNQSLNLIDMTTELQTLIDIYESTAEAAAKVDALAAVIRYCDINGENVLGLQYVDSAHELIEKYDRKILYTLFTSIGNISMRTGRYSEAIHFHRDAYAIAKAKKNERECSLAYYNLGVVYYYLGEYSTALEHIYTSLSYTAVWDDQFTNSNCYNALGEIYRQMGNYDLSIQNLFTALSKLSSDTHSRQIALCKQNIGSTYMSVKEFDLSMQYYKEALEIYIRLDAKELEAKTLSNIGALYGTMEKYEEAIEYFLKSIEQHLSIGGLSKESLSNSYCNLAEAYYKCEDYSTALENLTIALRYADEIGAKHRLFEIHEGLYKVYKQFGDHAKALEHHELYVFYKEQVYSLTAQENLHKMEVVHKIESYQRETEFEQTRNIALHEANQKLKELNEEKDGFLAIAAHDLKNPLTGILYISNAMKSGHYKPEEIYEFGEMLRSSSQAMFDLISNLLDSNKFESGSVEPVLTSVDAAQLLRHLTKNYRQIAARKNISVFCNVPRDVFVIADMQLLRQVIDNLLSNAIKYSKENTEIHAEVRIHHESQTTEICIKDNGPGISETDQKKLFGKFQRLTAKPTGGEHSTGLGLSICKKLVELMKGTIRCESEIGKGSTFIIEFPSAEEELFEH
ncbi:MAG: GatB/YqeY domain-containing protein [Ignavibacteria bacterium]|nr:GatB/YqeY domain-containing protein [Ignavibacteria bacterium]